MEIPSSRCPKFFHIWDFWAKRRKRGAVLTKRFFLKAPTERITENWKGKYHKSISNFDFLVGSDSSCFLGFSLKSWSCSGKIHPSFSSLSRSPPGKGLKWGGIWGKFCRKFYHVVWLVFSSISFLVFLCSSVIFVDFSCAVYYYLIWKYGWFDTIRILKQRT